MPGFKKMEPMSRALRPGGAGVVNPQDVKGGDVFDLGAMKGPKDTAPGGPTTIGKGVAAPKMPKMPRAPSTPKAPRAPQMPKGPKFR